MKWAWRAQFLSHTLQILEINQSFEASKMVLLYLVNISFSFWYKKMATSSPSIFRDLYRSYSSSTFCFDLYWKYHNFERNEILVIGFLIWTDFKRFKLHLWHQYRTTRINIISGILSFKPRGMNEYYYSIIAKKFEQLR